MNEELTDAAENAEENPEEEIPKQTKVVVTGASGFVGSHIVDALTEAGHFAVGLSRSKPSQVRKNRQAVYFDKVDVGDRSTWPKEAFENAEVVVHCVGIIREKGKNQTFQRIHVEGTRNVLDAARASCTVRHFIYISAIGSTQDAKAEYSRTKSSAEDLIRQSGALFTILRPSIILGPDGEFVEEIGNLILHGGLPLPLPFPFIPVPGNGKNKFQAIYISNLAQCVINAIATPKAINQMIEVGGTTEVTFDELLAGFARKLNVRKPLAHIPLKLMMSLAPLFAVLPNPPVTRDQLLNLGRDNICDITRMREILKVQPLAFDNILAYLFS
jgi:nucleoside-diphosphate-sugar epimerase